MLKRDHTRAAIARLAHGASAASVAWLLAFGSPAYAQAGSASDDEETSCEAETDPVAREACEASRIVVTATGTNIAGVEAVGSETITLDREQILASGKTSAADVVRTLPQVRNLGEFREGGTAGLSGNSQQGNAINLRGLGQAATLLLVDGRRVVATGAGVNFQEANRVPLAAIERIEVVADGVSAVYGSDAIAGVVNYVLRKDYEGVEASLRVSNTQGPLEMSPSITAGTRWSLGGRPGNVIVSYEYTDRDKYLRGNNPYLRQDLRPVGGFDQRLNNTTATAGTPGNIVVAGVDPDGPGPGTAPQNPTIPRAGTNVYYGLPAGANVGLTAASLRLNQPNIVDSADYNDYVGKMHRNQVTAIVNQEVTDWLEVFVHGTYSDRVTTSRSIAAGEQGQNRNVTLSYYLRNANGNFTTTRNPYYIVGVPGVAQGATPADLTVQYSLFNSIGVSSFDAYNKAYTITGGFEADLPYNWKAEAYYTFARDRACNFCMSNMVNGTALQRQIDLGNINPLSSNPLTAAQLQPILGYNVQKSGNGFDDAVIRLNGPLFDLPAGKARAAFGGERTVLSNFNINGASRGVANVFNYDTTQATSLQSRTVWSAFGELYLPLVSEDMNVPLVEDLLVNLAVRHDSYSDAGKTTNPKVGVTWDLADFFSLRGSWGTSFRAPGLPDVNPFSQSAAAQFGFFPNNSGNPNIVSDVCFGPGNCFTTASFVQGANPDLKPEEATNWSLGGDIRAPFDRNLRIGATYYNITFSGRISSPDAFTAILAANSYPNYNGLSQFIHPINNPATCVNTDPNTFDPVLRRFTAATYLYSTGFTNPCAIKVLLDIRNTNLSATEQDGLDFQLDYMIPFKDGGLTFNGNANWTMHNREQINPGGPFRDRVGLASTPIEWRGRGSVGGFWKGFNANLFANYTGSYLNDQAVDATGAAIAGGVEIPAQVLFDLNFGYSSYYGPDANLKGARASINIQNLLDKDPPLMRTPGGVFNAAYSNPFGRTVTVQVTMSF